MAIVGGGPVGLGLAVELGQRGVDTVVIEKERTLHRIPKGQNLTQRTMEHFRTWGIESQVRAARLMPAGYPASGVNAYGDLMSEYAHPWFRRSRVADYYFAANERLPQYLTERVLRDRIGELPFVTARFGVRARRVRQDDSSARVDTDDGEIVAEFVIGCDGSHSIVREQAGIGESRSDHDRRMVLLVFRSHQLHEILTDRFGDASFFNVLHPDLDGYWRFLGRVDVGEGWFLHAPVATGTTTADLDHAGLLRATVGASFAVEIDYMGFWDLRIAVADDYRQSRVFIAGDAAHSHPPYGGYGINTGFEDARNLGWKLAAVVHGWAGPRLLDSYTAERRAVFVSTAQDFIETFIDNDRAFIAAHDPARDPADFAAAWERRRTGSHGVTDYAPHYTGSPLVSGPPGATSSAVGTHELVARIGHHLPPPAGPHADQLFSALGSGFALLVSEAAEHAVSAFADAARAQGVPLTVIDEGRAAGLERYGAPLVLVRPDHYVAWVGDGSQVEPHEVLRRAIGG